MQHILYSTLCIVCQLTPYTSSSVQTSVRSINCMPVSHRLNNKLLERINYIEFHVQILAFEVLLSFEVALN